MRMTDIAIDRPVTTTMVTLCTMVLGLLAIDRLGLDLFPDVSFPVVTITTLYPGAGPAEVEAELTEKLEEAVASINGIDRVRSYSRDSSSQLIVQFEMDVDVQRAVNDVRDRVAAIRGLLPRSIEDPVIERVDFTALPVMTWALGSSRSPLETRRYADDVIRPAMERVDGVASVSILGGAEREIRVEIDRQRLEDAGLTVAQVAQVIGAESMDLPSGRLEVGPREEGLKASGRFDGPEEVGALILMGRSDGSQVRVRDVARVVDGIEEQRTLTRVDGEPAVTLEVQKQGGTNTVAVVEGVEKAVAGMDLADDITLRKIIDSAGFIKTNISNLWHHLIVGGAMAVLVIFLFMLDWRSTVISALALPTSIIATFLVMWWLGFSLNMMSMLGLTLAIGILIDDSVVVRENIFRFMEQGYDPVTAAREGTKQIAMAVFATTLTIVAVFVPVAFTGGMIGNFFREFGLTVAAAVLISLVVSFTIDPMLSARVTQTITPDHHERQRKHWLWGWLVRFYDWMDEAYRTVLKLTLRHKIVTVGLAIATLVGSFMLMPYLGQEFAGRDDRGEFTLALDLPGGTSLEQTDARTRDVEKMLLDHPEILTVSTVVAPGEVANMARLRVLTTPKTARDETLGEIMETVRGELSKRPGLDFYMREAGIGEASLEEAPVTIFVRGSDYDTLGSFGAEVLQVVRTTPGIRDASLNYRPGASERRLSVDRERAADRGVSFSAVAMTLRTALQGEVVSQIRDGEKEVDLRVEMRPEDREDLRDLEALQVMGAGGPVRLSEITRVDRTGTPSTIERYDRSRQVTITANVYDRSLGEVLDDLRGQFAELEKPPGYSLVFGGEAEQMDDTFANLGLAMGLAVLFIYFVLASQFESVIHPLTIMLALPLAIVGAILALFLMDKPFGMAAMIGVILLMGLVTKNSILLVDYAGQLREQGMSLRDALLEAGPTRLRPILMTSAAIVLGMLPTALSDGEGAAFQAPMSIAVIGGVITSTILTLVVVPAVYEWMDRLTLRGRRERKALRAATTAPAEAG